MQKSQQEKQPSNLPDFNLIGQENLTEILSKKYAHRFSVITIVVVLLSCGVFLSALLINDQYDDKLRILLNERDLYIGRVQRTSHIEETSFKITSLVAFLSEKEATRVLVSPRLGFILNSIPSDIQLSTFDIKDPSALLVLSSDRAISFANLLFNLLQSDDVESIVLHSVILNNDGTSYGATLEIIFK